MAKIVFSIENFKVFNGLLDMEIKQCRAEQKLGYRIDEDYLTDIINLKRKIEALLSSYVENKPLFTK